MKKIFGDYCRDQEKLFKNFPLDSKGNVVPLTDFTLMSRSHLLDWIQHLSESFSEGSKHTQHPFRFKTRNGLKPKLTILRSEAGKEKAKLKEKDDSSSEDEDLPIKKKRRVPGAKGDKDSGSKKRKLADDNSDDEDPPSTKKKKADSGRKSAGTTRKSSRIPTRRPTR